jgi:hypothetical protein
MVNPSPTHAEIEGDIVTERGLEMDQIPKLITNAGITHGMLLKHDATTHDAEEIEADATVRPVYVANVTEMNTAKNGDKTVHVVKKGKVLLKTKSILKYGDKVQTDGTSKDIELWAGAAGADIGVYKGHLNEGDRKYPYTNAAVDDLVVIDFYGGIATGDAIV